MKIYLFGSNGMLGFYVKHNLLAHRVALIEINRNLFDIVNDDWDNLDSLLDLSSNDVIINCSGAIPQKISSNDYKTFIKVNTLFPRKLNEIKDKYGCKFIHITTDCVFDGSEGNYNENSAHTESGIYGVSKSLGEPRNCTIIRTSIIGEDNNAKKNLLEWIKLNKNKEIQGFVNHYWNGVSCLTLANIIYNIINKNLFWNGVRHIYSPDIVSKYDLCCIINKIYKLNISILKKDTEMVNKTLTSLYHNNFNINSIENQLVDLYIYSRRVHVLGKNSFIGKALYEKINSLYKFIYSHTEIDEFEKNINDGDIVINCCGINISKTNNLFYEGNSNFVEKIVNVINKYNDINFVHISTIQCSYINNDTIYKKSKLLGETHVINNCKNFNILRLTNVLDKGIKPYTNNFIYTMIFEKKYKLRYDYKIYNNKINIISLENLINIIPSFLATCSNKIYNIQSEYTYEMKDIINIIHKNIETLPENNVNILDDSISNIYVKNDIQDIQDKISEIYENL